MKFQAKHLYCEEIDHIQEIAQVGQTPKPNYKQDPSSPEDEMSLKHVSHEELWEEAVFYPIVFQVFVMDFNSLHNLQHANCNRAY